MTTKELTDLYVKGVEVVLKDGTLVWLQKLSPYEQGECRRQAGIARARTLLALKEVGSDELTLLESQLTELKREDLVQAILGAKYSEMYLETINELDRDPDWTERNEVRTSSRPADLQPGTPEDELLTKLEHEYAEEILQRLDGRQEAERTRLEGETEEALRAAYRELHRQARGNASFTETYRLLDLAYMARRCRATHDEEGFNHDDCDHTQRLFGSADDIRLLPEELLSLLRGAEVGITMSVRDARFSARQGSSSDSSPLPSEPAGSESSSPTVSGQPAGTSR